MSFLRENMVHWVVYVDPLTVLRAPQLLLQNSATPIHVAYESNQKAFPNLKLRGSTPAIEFEGGLLFVVHETVVSAKMYTHRFLYMKGNNYELRLLSRPFFLVADTVEFVLGILMTDDEKSLILSFGYLDKQAAFRVIHIESPKDFLQRPYFWTRGI